MFLVGHDKRVLGRKIGHFGVKNFALSFLLTAVTLIVCANLSVSGIPRRLFSNVRCWFLPTLLWRTVNCRMAPIKSTHPILASGHIGIRGLTCLPIKYAIYWKMSLFGGTDGDLLNGLGTFCFLWGSPELDNLILSGKGRVPGSSLIMSSKRKELCGIFAAMTYLWLVVKFYHVVLLPKNASCCIYCDSKAALKRAQDSYYEGFGTTWWYHTHYDLEAAINHCLRCLSLHRPGHELQRWWSSWLVGTCLRVASQKKCAIW